MPPKAGEAIDMVEFYGWKRQKKTRGSHRQFEHGKKRGKVSVPGPLSRVLKWGTWKSIVRQADLPRRILREYPTWKRWR